MPALPSLPERPDHSHKGTFGTVIVLGGSPTMIGAPAICARAAFRSGAGLVKIATHPQVLRHAISIEPSATGIELDGQCDDMIESIEAADPKGEAVLAVGPGMGTLEQAGQLVRAVLAGQRRVVLDADGLNLLAKSGQRATPTHELVLTPHPGEFKRLAEPLDIRHSPTDPDERPQAAEALAQAHGAVVVLKGQRTVIHDGRRQHVNDTGNPALATAGSGDVLTGMIAARMAQGLNAYDAAVLGTHLHGRAADRWADRHGSAGLLARELADELPTTMREMRR